jgi:membrane-associated phospholipid phosphatase
VSGYLGIALVAGTLFGVLGAAVSHAPPSGFDITGRALLGGPQRLALLFTASCWWSALVAFGVLAVAVAIGFPRWRDRAVTSIFVALVTWRLSDAAKDFFHRPRPGYWRIIHESSYSYASGHAMFATVVYALWAYFIWKSDLPRAIRLIAAPVLLLWAFGILWSRLALGAHYVSDVVGGVLLGVASLAVASAVRAAAGARVRAAALSR